MVPDVNQIIRTYLVNHADVIAFFAPDTPRIYCPRAPENAQIPNVTFFVRGGISTPYIPDMPSPSLQFDMWADDPIEARTLYRTIYSVFQGIQNVPITVGATTYHIASAIEEVQGQDLMDVDISGRFRVLSFWQILIK